RGLLSWTYSPARNLASSSSHGDTFHDLRGQPQSGAAPRAPRVLTRIRPAVALGLVAALAALPMFLPAAFDPQAWAWLPEAAGQAAAALIVLAVWGLLYRSLDGLATRDRLLVFLAL